jgi:hypothetical protein
VNTSWCAFVRNDRGGLEPRRFASAADAASVALDRELPKPAEIDDIAGGRGAATMIPHRVFAKKLGVPPNTIRAVFKRGNLPGAVQHTDRLIVVPARLLHIAHRWGLLGLERMARAGLI